MKFIDKLERKFGNRGIENLTIYIIVSYVLGYALMYGDLLHGLFIRRVRHLLYGL